LPPARPRLLAFRGAEGERFFEICLLFPEVKI